ncbi:MAG: ABC transporter substrate-binding protein [Lachnospiraceae bacterium]|nr:ABC transporter substrate-binding protein [Lachnospiraceae bacterium]
MNKKRVLALLMAGAMVASSSVYAFADETESTTEAAAAEETEAAEETTGGDTPLVVGIDSMSEKFSSFFAENVPDQTIAELVGLYLVNHDRTGSLIMNGADGETVNYNGTDYTYNGLANLTITENEDTTVYNFKLRDDVVFSDGEPVNADDLIFTYYVLCDTDYDGNQTLYSTNIKGLQNYRLNSTAADSVTDEDVASTLADLPEDLAGQVKTELIMPLLTSEYDWADSVWEDYAEDYGVASGAEFFALLYSTDENYSAEGKDKDTIISEIADMYGTDYQSLAAAYGDAAVLDEDAASLVKAYLVDQKTAAGEGEEVPNIEGIKKINDYEVEITTDGFDAASVYQFAEVIVNPLHYFGDTSMYDYDNNQFGFTRGDLSAVREKSADPLGAGPYKFVKYENKTAYLEANENYFEGEPAIKYLQFRETSEPDKISGVQQGTIDLTDPSGSKSALEQIGEINGNGEVKGDVINTDLVDNLGYGYIGINAETVNVGGEPGSDASKDLRKALATVLAVYRDVAIDSYYGDAASVINYPISNTSWAAPQKSDADYEVAYSKDAEGNPIYTEGMTDDEKFAAASAAALGFFEAAGYTVSDGKITAAPEGAAMSYEIIIGGDGTGDHPTFGVLTDAKAALEKIGFTLEINDVTDQNIMWDAMNANTAQMWCAAWQATPDPDMYQVYHSESANSNYYRLNDATLDADIMDARSTSDQAYRKSVYKECLNIILDWGVEIPIYQRQNCVIMSAERIDTATVTPDITTYYYWYREIQNMKMK